MDIVTHGMMGLAVAAPFLGTDTGAAVGFILGSTLPDLDAFSRCFGKRAFLKWHQGWTHSMPVQIAFGTTGCLIVKWVAPELATLIVGLLAGAMTHSLLDLTNTYGIRIVAPFSRRRFCFEWMFFIDSVVLLLTVVALVPAVRSLLFGYPANQMAAILYMVSFVLYAGLKATLRRRASFLASADAVSVIPSAMWPWMFFECRRSGNEVTSSKLNAITGTSCEVARHKIHDDEFADELSAVDEFQTMSDLSPAYHVVERREDGSDIHIQCRDMQILNFNTSFGILDVKFNNDLEPTSVSLNV